VGDLRLAFGRHGGNLGQSGSVAYMFEPKGQIVLASEGLNEETVVEAAIRAGAEDVSPPEAPGGVWVIATAPAEFQQVKERLEAAEFKIEEAQIAMLPTMRVEVRGEEARKLLALLDAVEDLDDVQKVYANFDIPESELAEIEG
jgi:transcriptional/translational regulatory protein YebC/TACO1